MRRMIEAMLVVVVLAAVAVVGTGCQVGYRIGAPFLVNQRGPETNYNQERSGVTSRSTAAEQQVGEASAAQNQQRNSIAADMPTAMESTKQVGLKQGQAATTTKTLGDTSPGTTSSEGQAPVGQQGSDAYSLGQTPAASTTMTNPASTTAAPATAGNTGGAAAPATAP